MFFRARKENDLWVLANGWGHSFHLPCRTDYSAGDLVFGVVGTRADRPLPRPLARTKTELMARMLAEALPQVSHSPHLYLIDVRRDGVGAQSSWSPREFATLIPTMLGGVNYAYCHLPNLAPSIQHLADYRRDKPHGAQAVWRTFRDRYARELAPEALEVGRAFVEASAACGGIAVFLCVEAHQESWDSLPESEKDNYYCHRFTLAAQLAARMKAEYTKLSVKRVDLDLDDFVAQWLTRSNVSSGTPWYRPRVTLL